MKKPLTHHFNVIVIVSEFYGGMKITGLHFTTQTLPEAFYNPDTAENREDEQKENYHQNTDTDIEL